MSAVRLDILVEEESAEHLLRVLTPQIVPEVPFEIRRFSGKPALLRELPQRMRGYTQILRFDPTLRVVVLVDRDDEDCLALKAHIERLVLDSGLTTLSSVGDGSASVATRIAVEELEAWLFGDVEALPAGLSPHSSHPGPTGTLSRSGRDRWRYLGIVGASASEARVSPRWSSQDPCGRRGRPSHGY